MNDYKLGIGAAIYTILFIVIFIVGAIYIEHTSDLNEDLYNRVIVIAHALIYPLPIFLIVYCKDIWILFKRKILKK